MNRITAGVAGPSNWIRLSGIETNSALVHAWGRVADVVCGVELRRRVVDGVDRPEPFMLGPMTPVDEEIGDQDADQPLDDDAGSAERSEPAP